MVAQAMHYKSHDSPSIYTTPGHGQMTTKTDFISPMSDIFATPMAPRRQGKFFEGETQNFANTVSQSAVMGHQGS